MLLINFEELEKTYKKSIVDTIILFSPEIFTTGEDLIALEALTLEKLKELLENLVIAKIVKDNMKWNRNL